MSNMEFCLPEVYHHSNREVLVNIAQKELQRNSSSKDKYSFLQQISHCILTLHNEGKTWTELPINTVSNIAPGLEGDNRRTQIQVHDIRFLANLYCRTLTNTNQDYSDALTEEDFDCDEPAIALDIIRKMAQDEISMEEIIKHPFHWSCFQKVHFFCRVVDYIKAEEKDDDCVEKINLDDSGANNIIPRGGWIQKLELTDDELKLALLNPDKIVPAKNVIVNKAKNTNKRNPNEYSIFRLVLFFRNRYCHLSEDGDDIKACFVSYPEGYWKFFSSRFPKLFMHVYYKTKSYICTSDCKGEFGTKASFNFLQYKSYLRKMLPQNDANE